MVKYVCMGFNFKRFPDSKIYISRMRVEGSRYPEKKVADSKISGRRVGRSLDGFVFIRLTSLVINKQEMYISLSAFLVP